MKIDRKKLDVAMASTVLNAKDICYIAKMPRSTWARIISGHSVKPKTAGKVAKALGVSVESLLQDEAD